MQDNEVRPQRKGVNRSGLANGDLGFMQDHPDLKDVESDLARADWAVTPLGPVGTWDMRLRTMAGFVLRSPAPVCLFWGATGTMIFNAEWRAGLGSFQACVLGRNLADVQPTLADAYAAALAPAPEVERPGFATLLEPAMWRLLVDRPGVRLSCRVIPGDGGEIAGLLVQRLLGAAKVPGVQNRSAFLLQLSDTLRRLDEPDDIQTTGTRMLGEFLGADRASFAEIDEAAQTARIKLDYRRDPDEPTYAALHSLRDAGPALRMVQNGMPMVIRDVRAPEIAAADAVVTEVLDYAVAPFRALLAAPVMRQDKLVSIVTIRFDTPRDWSADELSVVHDAALRIWEALERARAETALKRALTHHRALFESIDEGVCLIERVPLRADGLRDYRYITMNPAMQAMFGVPDLSGQTIRENFPDEVEDWYDDWARVLETGEPIRVVRESKPQGMVLEMFVAPAGGLEGEVLLAVLRDVTARVRAEEAVRASEKRLSDTLYEVDEAFARVKKDLRVPPKGAAPLPADLRPLDEVVGRTYWEIPEGADDSGIGQLYQRALAGDEPVSLEHRYDWPDGSGATWLDIRALPVPRGLAVFWRAISRRKAAEEALRQSELRLRIAQKAAGVATFDWEIRRSEVTWSPEALGMMGLKAGALGGSYEDWIAMIHPDDLPRATEQIEWALEDGELEGEWRILRPDGQVVWVLVRGVVERDEQGRPVRLSGAQVDVTDRVRIDMAMRLRMELLSEQIDDLRRRLDSGDD